MTNPNLTPPALAEIINQRIDKDPGKARVHYGFTGKNPDDKWAAKHSEALTAAQMEVEAWVRQIDISPMIANAAIEAVGEEQVKALRERVQAPEGASLSELVKAVLHGQWSKNVIMLVPMNKPLEPWVHWAQIAMLRRMPWLGYDQEAFVSVVTARNRLAHRFLRSGAKWSFWLDADTVCPIGSASDFGSRFGGHPSFVERLNFQGVERLISRNKPICGAVVADRRPGNMLIIQPELNPQGQKDHDLVKELKRDGPQDRVIQVPYVGTGCVVIHRQVYEDIMAKFPERGPRTANEPYNFFGSGGDPTDSMGEDMAFCRLAAEAGHPAFLDLSVWCAHLGIHSFFPNPQI